ncbi:MAG: DUF5329 family protein [Gammaproteobacteria bacterium]|nr:DUF5329 family protein [Gammaproteobacteria bacterium]MDG2337842.1 DUF5329 family protein [Gammaproteobacteria bacterium]
MNRTKNKLYFAKSATTALCASVLALMLLPSISTAQSMSYEINRLISSVGRNGCTFIRNGERYRGRAAREHLRNKRKLNENLFATTEEFITKIASASATTGEPYLVRCRGQEETEVSEWFTALLEQFRTASKQDEDEA